MHVYVLVTDDLESFFRKPARRTVGVFDSLARAQQAAEADLHEFDVAFDDLIWTEDVDLHQWLGMTGQPKDTCYEISQYVLNNGD